MALQRVSLAAGILVLAPAAWGQAGTGGTISSGSAAFTQSAYTGDGNGFGPTTAQFRVGGESNPSHIRYTWWFFRIGQTRESALSGATSSSFSDDSGTLTYTYPTFTATLRYVVSGPTVDSAGRLRQSLTIQNTSDSPLTINLFNAHGLTLGGDQADDRAEYPSLPSAAVTLFTDTVAPPATPFTATLEGSETNTYGSSMVLGRLTDPIPSDFTPQTTVFTGTAVSVHQFVLTIPAGQEAEAATTLTIAPVPVPPCRADFDQQNGVQVADIFAFLRAWFAQNPSADFDQQNGIQVADIFAFLRAWFAGC